MLPYGEISAYSLHIPQVGGVLQLREHLTGYQEKIGDFMPKPTPREGWEKYAQRVARAADKHLSKVQGWALLPENSHAEVKVIFYGKRSGVIIAEVYVKPYRLVQN